MRSLSIAVTAACLAFAPFGMTLVEAAEPSEPTISDPTMLIESLTGDLLVKLVAELGGTKVEAKDESGKKIVTFTDADTPYTLAIAACEVKPGKCLAVAEVVVVTTGTSDVSLDLLNAQNRDGLFLVGFKLEGNKIGFGRVILIDGGVTKRNLAINIASFAVTFEDTLQQLRTQLTPTAQLDQKPTAAAMAGTKFTAVPADPKQISLIMDALLTQYKATVKSRRVR